MPKTKPRRTDDRLEIDELRRERDFHALDALFLDQAAKRLGPKWKRRAREAADRAWDANDRLEARRKKGGRKK